MQFFNSLSNPNHRSKDRRSYFTVQCFLRAFDHGRKPIGIVDWSWRFHRTEDLPRQKRSADMGHSEGKTTEHPAGQLSTFRLITGMIAPKTPITYETYAKSGLPFYNIYNEQPTKISGKFDAIQTIAEKEARVGYAVGFDFDPLRPALCSRCKTNFIDSLYVLDLQVKEDQHWTSTFRLRPCGHGFCGTCAEHQRHETECKKCRSLVQRVVTLAAPANPPGQGDSAINLPVMLLKTTGYPPFKSVRSQDWDDSVSLNSEIRSTFLHEMHSLVLVWWVWFHWRSQYNDSSWAVWSTFQRSFCYESESQLFSIKSRNTYHTLSLAQENMWLQSLRLMFQ